MKSLAISVGDRFGAWTVLGPAIREKRGEGRSANYIVRYPCRCDCGAMRDVRAFKLLGNSRSCGCLKRATLAAANVKHGHNRQSGRTRLYRVWDGMQQRCGNPNHDSFPDYGGRGIVICSEWRDFRAFAQWALTGGYDDTKQIDRIDNDDGYSPGNCRWVSDAANKRNTSAVRMVAAFGETKCLTDWALDPRCAVRPQTIHHRINVRGWTPERAITAPRETRANSQRFAGNHVSS